MSDTPEQDAMNEHALQIAGVNLTRGQAEGLRDMLDSSRGQLLLKMMRANLDSIAPSSLGSLTVNPTELVRASGAYQALADLLTWPAAIADAIRKFE